MSYIGSYHGRYIGSYQGIYRILPGIYGILPKDISDPTMGYIGSYQGIYRSLILSVGSGIIGGTILPGDI